MDIIFYARKGGNHIHSSKECPMLEGKQFEHYKYKEISLDDAQKQGLEICPCINKTFNSHHRLTVSSVRSLCRRMNAKLNK